MGCTAYSGGTAGRPVKKPHSHRCLTRRYIQRASPGHNRPDFWAVHKCHIVLVQTMLRVVLKEQCQAAPLVTHQALPQKCHPGIPRQHSVDLETAAFFFERTRCVQEGCAQEWLRVPAPHWWLSK